MVERVAKFAGYMNQRCRTCTYYSTPNIEAASGWCQRYPPIDKNGVAVFPTVSVSHWCGEYHEALMKAVNKLPEDMTLDELRSEYAHWNGIISEATHWGAHLAAAEEFRRECLKWIRIKSREGE